MPYSGVVYQGSPDDDDHIVAMCHHEHKTAKEALECGEKMARSDTREEER